MKSLKDNLHVVVIVVTIIAVYAVIKAHSNAAILSDNNLKRTSDTSDK